MRSKTSRWGSPGVSLRAHWNPRAVIGWKPEGQCQTEANRCWAAGLENRRGAMNQGTWRLQKPEKPGECSLWSLWGNQPCLQLGFSRGTQCLDLTSRTTRINWCHHPCLWGVSTLHARSGPSQAQTGEGAGPLKEHGWSSEKRSMFHAQSFARVSRHHGCHFFFTLLIFFKTEVQLSGKKRQTQQLELSGSSLTKYTGVLGRLLHPGSCFSPEVGAMSAWVQLGWYLPAAGSPDVSAANIGGPAFPRGWGLRPGFRRIVRETRV